MPKILLTQESMDRDFDLRCNDVFSLSLRTNYGRTGAMDYTSAIDYVGAWIEPAECRDRWRQGTAWTN